MLTLEWRPERSSLVVHLFSACCCVSSGATPDFRKATRKQVLVNRCSRTHVSSISSLVERILAGTEHTSFPLCLAPPPRWFMGKEEKGHWVFLLYSFTWLFYELLYFSPPVFLPLPSWKSHLLVRKFVCAVLFRSHGSSHSLSCVITGIFVVNVWAFKKKKNMKTRIHHVVAGAHVRRFRLWVWFGWTVVCGAMVGAHELWYKRAS